MKIKTLLLIGLLSLGRVVFGCHGSTPSLTSQVDNGDGSFTYNFTLHVDLGGLDVSFYGFVLEFLSSASTPVISSFSPTISSGDLILGSLGSDDLVGLTGSDINSDVNDFDWNRFENSTNILSYEHDGIFSITSSDFIFNISVTVIGCVEEVIYYAHPNSGAGICEYSSADFPSLSTGQNCSQCGSCTTPDCLIAGPYDDNATADIPANHCSLMNDIPDIPGAFTDTSYHQVTSGSNGDLGAIISVGVGGGFGCGITRSAYLFSTSPCSSGGHFSYWHWYFFILQSRMDWIDSEYLVHIASYLFYSCRMYFARSLPIVLRIFLRCEYYVVGLKSPFSCFCITIPKPSRISNSYLVWVIMENASCQNFRCWYFPFLRPF